MECSVADPGGCGILAVPPPPPADPRHFYII